ncbi:MAG: TrmH family RNA methyltransferase [Candidatus Saccharimonas sp.]
MSEITLLLHNIRSTHNVGSIFRTAEGFGVKRIVISGYTPYPKVPNDERLPHIVDKLTHQIHKTALGAEELVDFEHVSDLGSWLAKNELPLVGLEQTPESIMIDKFTSPDKFVLVLGEEVHGIDAELLTKCTATVEIPMFGKKESFNVSVAAGIALYVLQTV